MDEQIARLVAFIRHLQPTITQWEIADLMRGDTSVFNRYSEDVEDAEILTFNDEE